MQIDDKRRNGGFSAGLPKIAYVSENTQYINIQIREAEEKALQPRLFFVFVFTSTPLFPLPFYYFPPVCHRTKRNEE